MSQPNEPKNDQGEGYPNLPRAPIVEAVIHWLAQPGIQLDPDRLRQDLSDRVPDYPICQPQQGLEISATGGPGGASEVVHRTQWNGFRLKRDDEPFVAQFTPSGVVFSRLAPYHKWESFEKEGMRFWDLFVELAEPILVKRLGVRFINQITLGEGEKAGDILLGSPSPVGGIELSAESFFYQDTFRVPGCPYHVNWVRTIQPRQPSQPNEKALIVDIDVWASDISSMDKSGLEEHLSEMRKIKDGVFFNCMTPIALKRFGKP